MQQLTELRLFKLLLLELKVFQEISAKLNTLQNMSQPLVFFTYYFCSAKRSCINVNGTRHSIEGDNINIRFFISVRLAL